MKQIMKFTIESIEFDDGQYYVRPRHFTDLRFPVDDSFLSDLSFAINLCGVFFSDIRQVLALCKMHNHGVGEFVAKQGAHKIHIKYHKPSGGFGFLTDLVKQVEDIENIRLIKGVCKEID